MIKRNNNKILILSTACLLAAVSCAPVTAERGNMLEDHQLQQVTPGTSVRSDVLRILGSPTTQAPFDENIWYYIGQETEKRGIFDPEVTAERVVVVKFGEDGTVSSMRELPKNAGVDVPISDDKTDTKGNELTFLQQLLGNVGKFNKPTADTGRSGI